MIVLLNIMFDVLRANYTVATGTSASQPYLLAIPGHITRVHDSMFTTPGDSFIQTVYEIYCEPIYDIRRGDVIANIMRLDTGQPWFTPSDMEQWVVLQSTVSDPGFMEYRDLNIGRYVAGGPSQEV